MKTIICIGLAAVLGAGVGCSRDSDRPAATDHKVVDVDVDVNKEAVRRERDEFMRNARDQMNDLESDLSALNKQMEEGADAMGDDIRASMQALEREKDDLKRRMAAASERSEDEWQGFKANTNSALDRLEHGYNDLLDRMKTVPGEE